MSARMTRRRLLQYGAAGGVALLLPQARSGVGRAAGSPPLPKFMERLPVPGAGIVVAAPSSSNRYSFRQTQISRQLHPHLPPTEFWAYDDGSGLAGQAGSFGMAVVGQSGTPLTVDFLNDLPATYPSWIPVDTRLTPLGNQVRLMTHLHGGFVAAEDDGNPAITPNGFGPGQTQTVFYTNQEPQMPASLLWFHDHGLGATRLNVFAGLAAAYILRDEHDTGAEPNPIGIPGGAYEIPLVIQDTAVQPRRHLPLSRQRHRRRHLDRRVLRRRDAGQRKGLAVSRRRAAPVPVPDPERLQRAHSQPRYRRGHLLADRGRGRHVGPAGPGEQNRARAGRACGRAGRLPPARRTDPDAEEQQARRSGLDTGPGAAGGDADQGRDGPSASPGRRAFPTACPGAPPTCLPRRGLAT